jgi:MraZ protein
MVMLDGNGRFLIPKRYMNAAGIQQNVEFIGMGDTIEIWSAEKAEASKMSGEEFGKALENIMNISF